MEHKHKILAINEVSAKIAAALFVSAIGSGVAFAFSTQADLHVLQSQLRPIQEARIPEQIARIEEKLNGSGETLKRIESQQQALDDKLDRILARPKPHN